VAYLLLGFSLGLFVGIGIAYLNWRKLNKKRQAYKIAERVATAMEHRSNYFERLSKGLLTDNVKLHRENERLRTEKLKAWGIPDRM